ncbi:MAG: ATP-binding protein [Treponema sp.]
MLLEFRASNYKSFKEQFTFSMVPAPKQKGLDYSIQTETGGNKKYKSLCSSVIYGANAAGKTNIIGALDVFKCIILRGNIRNSDTVTGGNAAECILDLIPNNTLAKKEPVSFFAKFIRKDILYEYSISLDLGMFMEREYHRSILSETLLVNEKTVFKRTGLELEIGTIGAIKEFLLPGFSANKSAAKTIAQNSLNNEELFLTNGFKTIYSTKLSSEVLAFFSEDLTIFCNSQFLKTEPMYEKKYLVNPFLNEAAGEFGINSNRLVYIKDKDGKNPVLVSMFEKNKGGVPAEIFESYGTLRFINLFPVLSEVFKKGGTLLIDEFDTSLHPRAVMNLITIFHNDELNTNHAQLIFTTQNPMYLNNNLFRRDEIKFVERDDDTKCSVLYPLSDFGTKGTNARKGKDYMNNYFMDKYGAIRDVDFTPVFEKLMKDQNDSKKTD